jgi:hypothetical protein
MTDLPSGLSPLDFLNELNEEELLALAGFILPTGAPDPISDDPLNWPLCEKHQQPPGTCPYCHHGMPEPNWAELGYLG